METLWQDVRFAVRTLRRVPGFTALVIVTLGVGIGANAALFPFLHGVLSNPLGFEESDRLVYLEPYAPERNRNLSVSYPDFVDWRERNRTLENLTAYDDATSFEVSGDREPERVQGALASHSLTALLCVDPVIGRGFLPEDDRAGAAGVALVGYGLWQRRFGGDPDVVGRTITVNREQVTVVGIMPRHFRFPSYSELWMPLRLSPTLGRGNYSYSAVGRLRPGVSLEAAQADLQTIAAGLAEEYPATNSDVAVRLSRLEDVLVRNTREAVVMFYVVVTFVLLLACANVANLMLSRAMARQREIVVRSSLGAGQLRIARLLLTESVLVALGGCALGIVLGSVGRDLIVAGVPVEIPYYALYRMDVTVALWMTGIAAFCGILFGLAPLAQVARLRLTDMLQSSVGTSGKLRHSRLRSFLVTFEVGLALVILVAAGLMMKSIVRLRSVEPGFDAENVLTMRLALPETHYTDAQQREAFYRDLLLRVRALPGVVAASAVSNLPMGRSSWGTSYYVEGTEPAAPGHYPTANYRVVLPRYFETLAVPLLLGRDFDDRDVVEGALPVAIVNRQFAERHWPGESPIGKRIRHYAEPRDDDPWMEVVGVVQGVHHYGFKSRVYEGIYRPYTQNPARALSLVIKSAGDPLDMVVPVRDEVWSLDPDLPPYAIRAMEQVVREGNWEEPIFAWLFSVFSTIALTLAAVGVYGVVSYSVAQRSREFGIRLALGAAPARVVQLVLGQGTRLTALGLAAGLLLAFLCMRFIQHVFFGVSAHDPLVYGFTALSMAAVALVASYVPARRATRVDPADALRAE